MVEFFHNRWRNSNLSATVELHNRWSFFQVLFFSHGPFGDRVTAVSICLGHVVGRVADRVVEVWIGLLLNYLQFDYGIDFVVF